MKIALAQISLSENIGENLRNHERCISAIDSDLIIFPECSLSGYNLKTVRRFLKGRPGLQLRNALDRICNLSVLGNKAVIVGLPLIERGSIFNGACLATPDGNAMFYRKISLTEDEREVFKKGRDILIFTLRAGKFGLIICRDQSNLGLFDKLKAEKVNYVIIQSAHYYDTQTMLWKKYKNIAMPITRAIDYGVTVLKVNSVGSLNNLFSHGNTLVASRNGKLLGMLNDFEEGFLTYDVSGENNETVYSCRW